MNKFKPYDNNVLMVRNFPLEFSEQDIREFLLLFDPINITVSLENRWAFIHFSNAQSAKDVLGLVHQFTINENILSVEYKPKSVKELAPSANASGSGQTNNAHDRCLHCKNRQQNDIKECIKHLYANADNLDLTQPVPPYVKYQYPRVNRDIIDSICIALECSPKFYTQVLHLMNRINLEPPFVPNAENLIYEKVPNNNPVENAIDNSTQTDDDLWRQAIKHKQKSVSSDESELESSSSAETNPEDQIKLDPMHTSRKRKRLSNQRLVRNQIKKLLKNQQHAAVNPIEHRMPLKIRTNHSINDVFEFNPNGENRPSGIQIVKPLAIPSNNDATGSGAHIIPIDPSMPSTSNDLSANIEPDIFTKISVLSDAELNENRIPADQLETHPLFRNYEAGIPSNKLYIKNIAKEVTEGDLRTIYNRYLEENFGEGSGNIRTVDIRLMTSGRMKGQAFVTFLGPLMDDDDIHIDKQLHQIVERARRETNGLILKTKVIVVTFGKANK